MSLLSCLLPYFLSSVNDFFGPLAGDENHNVDNDDSDGEGYSSSQWDIEDTDVKDTVVAK